MHAPSICDACPQHFLHIKSRVSQVKRNNNDGDDNSCNGGVESPQANLLIDFYRKVVFEELRPSHNNLESVIPCPQISKLIQECWSADPDERPTFDEIGSRLKAIFNAQ